MKNLKTYLFFLSLLGLTAIVSCGGDDTPDLTPEEQRIVDLAGTETGVTWATTSVTFDGAASDFFQDLTITFRGSATTALTYTSSNGTPLFGASGTWAINGTNADQLIFDGDNSNVYNISVDATTTPATMTLTVNYSSGNGEAANINGASGTYVMNFEEQ